MDTENGMNQGNTQPPMGQAPMTAAPVAVEHSYGGLISIVIIVALLAAGAAYFYMQNGATPETEVQNTAQDSASMQASASDAQTDALSQTNSSDTAAAIEADLTATDLGDIEGEMNATGSGI